MQRLEPQKFQDRRVETPIRDVQRNEIQRNKIPDNDFQRKENQQKEKADPQALNASNLVDWLF